MKARTNSTTEATLISLPKPRRGGGMIACGGTLWRISATGTTHGGAN